MRGPPSSSSSNSSTASSKSGRSNGAANLSNTRGKSTGNVGGMQKRMIKDGDKSSGTNNLVGGGGSGNSLTGKNPYAVLKASSIAASQSAVFPNNFTNLPKVYPPFLPALEGRAKEEQYTLVLDLDETLIHNVEYG